jgi:hypothetical protein
MKPEEFKELFDELKSELVAIRTDLIIIKYSLEQIENQLENQPADNKDPFAGQTLHKL